MADYYDYITNRGVIVPDTSTVLSDVENEFKSVFGNDLDVSPETVQGRLIEMIAILYCFFRADIVPTIGTNKMLVGNLNTF